MASLSCRFVEDTGDLRGLHVVLSVSLPATEDLWRLLGDWESLVWFTSVRSCQPPRHPWDCTRDRLKREFRDRVLPSPVRCPCKDANGTRMEKTFSHSGPPTAAFLTHSFYIRFAVTVTCSPTHLSIANESLCWVCSSAQGWWVTLTCLFHMVLEVRRPGEATSG